LSPASIVKSVHWSMLRSYEMLRGTSATDFSTKYASFNHSWDQLNDATERMLKKVP